MTSVNFRNRNRSTSNFRPIRDFVPARFYVGLWIAYVLTASPQISRSQETPTDYVWLEQAIAESASPAPYHVSEVQQTDWQRFLRPERRNDWRSTHNANDEGTVDVPEPMLFDMVRPLGARRGELEANTLAIFPWRAKNRDLSNDPFGPGPQTRDLKGIEWAPEIEFAPVDNFAIEFELPYESSTLESYKLGLQWTIGTAFEDQYIHGFQMLIEPTVAWQGWNTTLLYIGGVRFDERWSALFMLGGRMNLRGPNTSETYESLFNLALFRELTPDIQLGVETNYAARLVDRRQLIVVPQIHCDLTRTIQIQAGMGFGTSIDATEESFIMRLIWSRD